MTEAVAVGPDERALRDHLKSSRYLMGENAGRWRRLSVSWPHAVIAIPAAPRRRERPTNSGSGSSSLTIRSRRRWGVPGSRTMWSFPKPSDRRATVWGHTFCFDWNNGEALYAAWDRSTLDHAHWLTEHPLYVWKAVCDHFLRFHPPVPEPRRL